MKALSQYHPVVLFVYFIGVILITMLTLHPIMLIFSFIGALLLAVMWENTKAIGKSMGFYIPMALLVAVTNPLFSHNGVTPLFFLNDNPVTLEAMLNGAAIGGMIIAVLYWCRCYSQVMTSDKLIYLLGQIIPKLSLILSMALRFIPLFTKRIKKIHRIQKTMGLYTSESMVDRLGGGFRIFSAMITWSLENAVETTASMRARGYGLPGRSNYSLFRLTKRDFGMLALVIILLSWSLWGVIGGTADFAFYPRLTAIKLSGHAVACYGGTLLLMMLPFLIEIKEIFVWRYWRSKI